MNKYLVLAGILLLVAANVLADSDSESDSDSDSHSNEKSGESGHSGEKHKHKHNKHNNPVYPYYPPPYGYSQYPYPYPNFPQPQLPYGPVPAYLPNQQLQPTYAPEDLRGSSVINHSLKVNKEYRENFDNNLDSNSI